MSRDPDRDPITPSVVVWFAIADRLEILGDDDLAVAIRHAMEGHRFGDLATFALTVDEQRRIQDQCLTLTEAQSAANWRRTLVAGLPPHDCFVVAEPPGGEPLGYAWGGPHDDPAYRGELRQIAVLPSAQRRGVGRVLVRHVASRLAAAGIHSLRVETLQVNPNRLFYERLGAHYLAACEFEDDGVVLPACRYGWADTRPLREG